MSKKDVKAIDHKSFRSRLGGGVVAGMLALSMVPGVAFAAPSWGQGNPQDMGNQQQMAQPSGQEQFGEQQNTGPLNSRQVMTWREFRWPTSTGGKPHRAKPPAYVCVR